MIVVISSDYLGPLEEISRGISLRFCGFGSFDQAIEKFHINEPNKVAGYIIAQDSIKKKDLSRFLDKCVLQVSEGHEPRVLIATVANPDITSVCRNSKYKNLDIGLVEYEIFSKSIIQRLYGTIFLENFDVFEGRIQKTEIITREPLPKLTTRNLLSKNIKDIFTTLESTLTVEDNIEVDSAIRSLNKINPVLGLLRKLVIYKAFGIYFTDYALLEKNLKDLSDVNLSLEYQMIYTYIKENFDAGSLRKIPRGKDQSSI